MILLAWVEIFAVLAVMLGGPAHCRSSNTCDRFGDKEEAVCVNVAFERPNPLPFNRYVLLNDACYFDCGRLRWRCGNHLVFAPCAQSSGQGWAYHY